MTFHNNQETPTQWLSSYCYLQPSLELRSSTQVQLRLQLWLRCRIYVSESVSALRYPHPHPHTRRICCHVAFRVCVQILWHFTHGSVFCNFGSWAPIWNPVCFPHCSFALLILADADKVGQIHRKKRVSIRIYVCFCFSIYH